LFKIKARNVQAYIICASSILKYYTSMCKVYGTRDRS